MHIVTRVYVPGLRNLEIAGHYKDSEIVLHSSKIAQILRLCVTNLNDLCTAPCKLQLLMWLSITTITTDINYTNIWHYTVKLGIEDDICSLPNLLHKLNWKCWYPEEPVVSYSTLTWHQKYLVASRHYACYRSSINKLLTLVTALRMRVCIRLCLDRPLTGNFKSADSNISWWMSMPTCTSAIRGKPWEQAWRERSKMMVGSWPRGHEPKYWAGSL